MSGETTLSSEDLKAATADRAEPAGESGTSGAPTAVDKTFNKSEFLLHPTTGENVREISRPGGRRRIPENIESQKVNFNGEVDDRFINYLSGKVGTLAELSKRRDAPAGYDSYLDYVLDSELASGGERRLVEACTDVIRGENGLEVRKLNEDKIDAFLSTSEGYKYTAQDMEQAAALSEMGLNMQGLLLPELERRELYQRMDVMFGKGGRIMDKLHWLNNQVPENIYRFFHATRFRSEALTPAQQQESVTFMQAMPQADRDYMFAVMGINVDAFDPATGDRQANSQIPEAIDSDTVLKNASLALNGRRLFLEKLGVKIDKIYTVEQVILDGAHRMAMAPTIENQQILDRYDAEYQAEVAAGHVPNQAEIRGMLNTIQRQIKLEIIESFVQQAETKTRSERDDLNLDIRLAERTDESSRRALIERRKAIGAADRELANGQVGEIKKAQTELVAPLEQANRAVEDQASQVNETHRLPIVGDLEASIADRINVTLPQESEGRITALEGQLAARISKIRVDNDFQSMVDDLNDARSDKREAITDARDQIKTAIAEYTAQLPDIGKNLPPVPGRAVNITAPMPPTTELANAGNNVAVTYDVEIGMYEAEIRRIEGLVQAERTRVDTLIQAERDNTTIEIKALKDAQIANRTAEGVRTKAARAVADQVPDELANGAARYAEIQTFVDAGGNRIVSDDQLRALPITEIMQRLENVVPDEENRRLIASFAKSERRRVAYENSNPPSALENDALNGITGLGVNAEAILLTSDEALSNRINASTLGWNPAEITQNILAARHLVAKRLSISYSTRLANEATYWEARSAIDNQAGTEFIRQVDQEKDQLEVAKALLNTSKIEELYGRANSIVENQNQALRERLVDRQIVDQNDVNYSQEERNKELPAGYVEWMRLIYPEYDGDPDESKKFNALHALMPPQELAEVLNHELTLMLGLGGNPDVTLDAVFSEINNIGGFNQYDRADFNRISLAIINSVRQKERKIH